ncbi:ZNF622 [Cordylochernes scorpioides]|uniref:ZNF622 n=1 Tax=Cordylochernes scorpioides TaxID=51811 RepID=A0ABY6LS76_9ARAC|nr:ZNF622 [Cordylochernes scorpioides]
MVLTCITCRIVFNEETDFRDHYKSKWHRYNSKRQIINYPPISLSAFNNLTELKEKENEAKEEIGSYCNYCRKHFSTSSTYQNHLESKKHKQAIKNAPKDIPLVEPAKPKDKEQKYDDKTIKQLRDYRKKLLIVQNYLSDDEDWESCTEDEECDDEEMEIEIIEEKDVKTSNCLFCSKYCGTLETNLKHMTKRHRFYIPFTEHLTDLKGLITYLHEKIRIGHLCLWCNEKSHWFYSLLAVQRHMVDKGHCKMRCERDCYEEYTQFYDFSSIYPDDFKSDDDSEPGFQDTDIGLRLPSGMTITTSLLLKRYAASYPRNLGSKLSVGSRLSMGVFFIFVSFILL